MVTPTSSAHTSMTGITICVHSNTTIPLCPGHIYSPMFPPREGTRVFPSLVSRPYKPKHKAVFGKEGTYVYLELIVGEPMAILESF